MKIFSMPKDGWVNINIEGYEYVIGASYLTDVPMDFLNAIIAHLKYGIPFSVSELLSYDDVDMYNDSDDSEPDPLLEEAMELVIETGQVSTSFIQRKFKIGYARAGRIVDQLEERGIISGYQGSKPRQVLMTMKQFIELKNSIK